MRKNIKVGFVSLGCPKNLTDTEVMIKLITDAGYSITTDETKADIIVVNTCAFIESAKRESIDTILDLSLLKENKSLRGIIAAGCMAERYRDELFRELPEIDAAIGVGSVRDIVAAVDSVIKGKQFESFGDKNSSPLGGERVLTTEGYAYLKIAEGCNNRCSYCAIPSIRGRYRSRPEEELVEEAKTLALSGTKELIIVAQDITRYGIDLYGEARLPSLLRKITEAADIPWVRLMYCYPDMITDELIAEIRDNDKILKYIDLPIQLISENVLSRMNRHGGSRAVRDAIRRLRDAIPDIVIRSTVIVGFPGETEEDFTELCDFVEKTRFDRLGAFTYSREGGAPAYDFDDQIDEQTKQDRCDYLMGIQLDIVEENNAAIIGKTIDVLVEGFDMMANAFYGRSAADAPDIDSRVYIKNCTENACPKAGTFARVLITDTLDYDLIGELA